MTKPGYYQIRLTDENEMQIRAVCKKLGIDPEQRGAYSKAINFVLRVVVFELVGGKNDNQTMF